MAHFTISAPAINWQHRQWPIAGGFRISRGEKHVADVIEVTIQDQNGHSGRGECVPYARYGESLTSVTAQLDSLEGPLGIVDLPEQLPPGAARNAVDCALWDLHAQSAGKSVRTLLALPKFSPCTTAYTLSLADAGAMAEKAASVADRPLLKLKLAGDGNDVGRLQAIHAARPDARLILDGNEGFDRDGLLAILPTLESLPIAALEQPLSTRDDAALCDLDLPFPVCADESAHTLDDLESLIGKYSMVNVKLDKSGGLTEALRLVQAARNAGLGVMVGCMVGSSLAMAPALVLSDMADLVDLDGPLLLERDHENGMAFAGAIITEDAPGLWGYPR